MALGELYIAFGHTLSQKQHATQHEVHTAKFQDYPYGLRLRHP